MANKLRKDKNTIFLWKIILQGQSNELKNHDEGVF